MNLRAFISGVFSIVLVCVSLAAETANRTTQDFRALIEKVWAAWDTMDPNNAAPFYAKEADHVFFDIAPLKYNGWQAYADGVSKIVADYSSIKLNLGPDLQVHQHGNLTWTTATLQFDAVRKNGAKESLPGRWTAVWEKRGKDWLIVHEHTSVPWGEGASGGGTGAGDSLYKRLGGYDAIAAVTDDFIGRLINDKELNRFFGGVSTDSQKRIRQLVVDQLCNATGGPCYYIGRSMKTSHEGLGISEKDWQIAVQHLGATLDKFKVGQREKDEVLSAISGLKGDIVSASAPAK